jgi:hypothetical protein
LPVSWLAGTAVIRLGSLPGCRADQLCVDGTLRYPLRLEVLPESWRLPFSEVVRPQGLTHCDLRVAVA